ncbi:conserved protein of unknown function [Methylocaldum szegediense]|jgi:hypothetical protein|uniref:Uncharacterized protein n=1 Tax=Methylocaldum szegediense TaxID=73780 RepID=A0ABM9HYR2_9GAMM|nr:conserved protein of unknown function [Methylocaldum szegediense]
MKGILMNTEKDNPASDPRATLNERQASEPGTAEGAEFPSARYFQIHFDYLNERLRDLRHRLNTLQQQISDFQRGSDHDQAEENKPQSTRTIGNAVDGTPKHGGTAPYSATRPSVGPTISLQRVDKRRKPR